METIALFPIPGSVSFPGTTVPLHVFEPRYRKMVDYCISNNVLLGIAHTERLIRKADNQKNALNSNASTYKACNIFSAGECKLKDTLEDGRLLIHVKIKHRYKSLDKVQALPFELHQCEIVHDKTLNTHELGEITQVKEKVITRLKALCSESTEMVNLLKSPSINTMTPIDFSFRVFQLIKFDPDDQQSVLEIRSPLERLHFMLTQLNQR